MPGDLDPRYVRARKVLLDALDALGSQRRAVVLLVPEALGGAWSTWRSPRPAPRQQGGEEGQRARGRAGRQHPEEIAAKLARLTRDSLAGEVTLVSLGQLRDLFGDKDAPGTQMVVQGTAGVEDPTNTAASCAALAIDLLTALKRGTQED